MGTVGVHVSDLLKRFGVDPKVLSTRTSVASPKSTTGRILLYDGDGACYQHTNGVAKIETALRRFHADIETHMYLAKCSTARVHLTPRGCYKNGRHLLNTVKPYQANRNGKQKPPLLEVLRAQAEQYFKDHPTIEILAHHDIEADDGLMIDAYSLKNTVMISADKDLRINPFESYDVEEGKHRVLPNGDTYGWIDRKFWCTPSGKASSKMIGHGTRFFLAQMLMGDSADNVQGILKYDGKLCGEAGAYNLLHKLDCEHAAVNMVLDGYRWIDQNPMPEAFAMWLLRNRDDDAYKYFTQFELTSDNKAFLDDCYYNRIWRREDEDATSD